MADPSPPVGSTVVGMSPIGLQMLYANGFAMQMTATEVGCIFTYDNGPMLKVVMPFSVALSMITALQSVVSNYELSTNSKLLPIEALMAKFAEALQK